MANIKVRDLTSTTKGNTSGSMIENLTDTCNTLSAEELNLLGGATALAIGRNGGVGYGFAAFGVAFGIGGAFAGGRFHYHAAFSLY
jgi:hypothetical protein